VGGLVAQRAEKGPEIKLRKAVLAAFRPESVSLRPQGGVENRIAAKRIATTYLGEMAEHLVELGNGQRIKAFELNPGPGAPAAGEEVTLYISAANVMLVEP
jgi:hypothetical protein